MKSLNMRTGMNQHIHIDFHREDDALEGMGKIGIPTLGIS